MATNTNSASQSEVLCKYFQNGVCGKGEDCCFSHNRTDRPDNICKFYLQGDCSYGKACKFDHYKPQKNTSISQGKSKLGPSNSELFKFLDKEFPSKLVSLTKMATTSSRGDEEQPVKHWVDAPEFVPGQKYRLRTDNNCNSETKKIVQDDFLYSEAIMTGVEYLNGMTEEEASLIPCPFAAMESCKLKEECPYLHGLQCDICNDYCLDPNDPVQQKEHQEECMKGFEEDMKYSFAVQKSDEVSCGICLDKIRLNSESKDKRFGILPECNHPFCLTCIRTWRSSSKTKDKIVRACPLCRISSGFVIPSEVWVDDEEEKASLIKNYKEAMSTKPCKHFDYGNGTCPFGASCFYKHANADGTVSKEKVRRYDDSDGESRIINPLSLWQFIEARDSIGWEDLLEQLL